MDTPAPFFSQPAGWPEGGQAFWLKTQDGIRIRTAIWAPDTATLGTILMLPGRTEYIEKYGDFARDMGARGFATLCVDWRGQGLADKLVDNPMLGHVEDYRDYQKDVAALLTFLEGRDLPQPLFMVAHSMSGATGLRALHEKLPVKAACFTGPMWGIAISSLLKPVAMVVRKIAPALGLNEKLTPTTSLASYVLTNPFDDNMLTTDPAQFDMMRDQLNAKPELALGGPTVGWFSAAIAECQALAELPSPATPCLTIMGSNERIVDQDAIRDRMSRWPNGHLDVVQDGEHEVLMETASMRLPALDSIADFFKANR